MWAPGRCASLLIAAVVLVSAVPAALAGTPGGFGHGAMDLGNGGGAGAGESIRDSSESPFTTWQSYAAPTGFPSVYSPGVAADPADHALVVFGGCTLSYCGNVTNETWTESNGLWTELRPNLSPAPRAEAQMAWDPADGYVLLFGGNGCLDPPACTSMGPLNDTWALKDGTWNPVISSGPAPPPTDQGGLAYDPSERDMVLFGGSGCASQCETWTYSGGTWTELNLTVQPPARYAEGFAEDGSDNGALLFGGLSFGSGAQVFNDTWLFANGVWLQETGSPPPSARWSPAMAWDPGSDSVVLYGGAGGTGPVVTLNDTWQFQAGEWSRPSLTQVPNVSWANGFALDPTTGVLVLVGVWNCNAVNCSGERIWGFGPLNPVGLSAEAGTCANFTIAGATIASGDAAELQNGTYPLRVAACTGFLLANLTASALLQPNATSQNVTEWNGSVLVHGGGSILVNLTRVVPNPQPTGLEAISVLGLTFLELLLILVALVAVAGIFVAIKWTSRRRSRPPPT